MSNRAKRDLEEARKSGVIPPEKDAATGELINPHIPEFMAKAPWYLNQAGPGLGHQRKEEAQRNAFGFETFYRRGEFSGQASSYRKGACRNCGSMTHKEKDCVDRPRKVGAWKSNANIAPDEVLPGQLSLDWDSKRDRCAAFPYSVTGALSRTEPLFGLVVVVEPPRSSLAPRRALCVQIRWLQHAGTPTHRRNV
jgi:pre-mRNA-processing factor SLU7